MAPLSVLVTGFLVIFYGNIESTVGQDLVVRNTSQCVDCCNKVASHTTILSRIVSRQDREIQNLVEIKAKIVDDFPPELEKLSTDLDALKSAVTDGIPTEMEKQSLSLKEIAASLVSLHDTIQTVSGNLQLLEGRLKVQEQLLQTLNPTVKEMHDSLIGPKDCSDIRALGYSTSGVYRVYPGSLAKRIQADVYCDMTTPGGSWLVFQRRKDGSLNFEQTWSDYAAGFGNVNSEFWLGDSFSGHNGMQFSTKDADNDIYKEGSCSLIYHGGWWYSACHASNLNGLYLGGPHKSYADGIEWYAFRGYYYSLKTTEMKIAVAN